MELNRIYNMDCLEGMKNLPNDCIDMVITSPPYDNLRKYGNVTSWNNTKFRAIAKQISRVLSDGAVCVWVVSDATINGTETGTSFRQALYFKDECGLLLYDTMIFQKSNPLPKPHLRYNQDFDFMFVFSKGKPKVFNPIMVDCKTYGRMQEWGTQKINEEKSAKYKRYSDRRKTKNKKIHGNIFSYAIGGIKIDHPAIFPIKLALDQISTWTNEGGIVLDPFSGSGTTAEACHRIHRNFIAYEINKKYYDLSIKRLSDITSQLSLF